MVFGGKESETYECEYGYVIGRTSTFGQEQPQDSLPTKFGLFSRASPVERDSIGTADKAFFSQNILLDLILPIRGPDVYQ